MRTLVLNADGQPCSIFPLSHIAVEDAITRVVSGTCTVVSHYSRYIKAQRPAELRKYNLEFYPSVIQRLRYDVTTRNPRLTKEGLYYRDHAQCIYCSKRLSMKKITIEHVLPRSCGGKTTWGNLAIACEECNIAKSNSLPTGKWKPRYEPYKPTYWQLAKARKKFPITIPHHSWLEWLNWESAKVVENWNLSFSDYEWEENDIKQKTEGDIFNAQN